MQENPFEELSNQMEVNKVDDQYGVAKIPAHTHNRIDSLPVSYLDLTEKQIIISQVVPGTAAATTGNYGVFFIAPAAMTVMVIQEVHQTAGGVNPTLNIEKLTGTQASGAGLNILTTAFNLALAANTVRTGTLTTVKSTRNLAVGDRLGLVAAGTYTTVNNVVVSVQLQY